MDINGTVQEVEINVTIPKNGGGSYKGSILRYKDAATGKDVERAFHENTFKFNKKMLETLKSLTPGDTFKMPTKQDGKYWNPTDIIKTDGQVAKETTQAVVNHAKNDDKRQLMIISQSCIGYALEFMKLQEGIPSFEDVIRVAKDFELHVLRDRDAD